MCDCDFGTLFDEYFLPEVLDQGIGEKAGTDPTVVFSENLCEENSVNVLRQVWYWPADGAWEEQCEHLDNTRYVLQSIWQFQVILNESGDVLDVVVRGPVYI